MGKITLQNEAKIYYLGVKEANSVYVWNMNYDTIITKESIDKAYADWYACSKGNVKKYNRSYYNDKLKEGKGRPGSDCSGMHYKLSGYDKTAQGYYDEEKASRKGGISSLPLYDCVLLFKGQSSKNITHTGIYLGDGMVIHMKNSSENCVYESVDKHNWGFWSYAKFIDYSVSLNDKPKITRNLRTNCKGIDVKLLQSQLIKKGYACGTVDGEFGKKTNAAVKKFQLANGLTADGIAGKNTVTKLDMIWLPM